MDELARYIRDVPDFPSPGILFRDLTPLLHDPGAFAATLSRLEAWARLRQPTLIAGIDSRGFLFGAPLALRLGIGFVPLRKPGKLPWARHSESYTLEYGSGTLEMHQDAVAAHDRVLIVDDLLATGGTAAAAARLIARGGGEVVGALFVVELEELGGRARLPETTVHALLKY